MPTTLPDHIHASLSRPSRAFTSSRPSPGNANLPICPSPTHHPPTEMGHRKSALLDQTNSAVTLCSSAESPGLHNDYSSTYAATWT
jgi:hypothetical protein